MNKKAQEMAIYGVFALIFIILLLVVYWMFFVIPTSKFNPVKETLVDKENSNFNLLLLNYLRTPVVLEGNKLQMSDLIRLSLISQQYDDRLKMQSEKIFDNVLDKYQYRLKIDDEYLINKITEPGEKINSTVEIPNFEGNINIELEVRII